MHDIHVMALGIWFEVIFQKREERSCSHSPFSLYKTVREVLAISVDRLQSVMGLVRNTRGWFSAPFESVS